MGQQTGILENDLNIRATDGAMLPAFLCEPPDVEGAPLVVIAPEAFGLTPWVRSVAKRLAHEGFRAVTLEIFARDMLPPGADLSTAIARIGRTSYPQAVADLRSALDHVEVSGEKLGSIGFCMGGSLSLLLAADGRRLDAAVACYGFLHHRSPLGDLRPEQPIDAVARIRCPVLGVYGKNDGGIPAADVDALRAQAPAGSDVHLYDAGHAFLNDTRPELHSAEQATLAWAKIVGFLRRNLT
jgi:carboxymethylenebutenolidase